MLLFYLDLLKFAGQSIRRASSLVDIRGTSPYKNDSPGSCDHRYLSSCFALVQHISDRIWILGCFLMINEAATTQGTNETIFRVAWFEYIDLG